MQYALIYSRAQEGLNAPLVTVETHLSPGLPSFSIVGLAETSVKESKDRVRSAILNASFDFPARRITVNLAPADIRKEGGRYDLAIALGILCASKQIPANELLDYEFAGELGLAGELRSCQGTLVFAVATKEANRTLICPEANQSEALLANGSVLAARHLLDICQHFKKTSRLSGGKSSSIINPPASIPNMADLRGQQQARRVLEIIASGKHSCLMVGPPGTGKTLLASCLPGILPPISAKEALDIAKCYSLSHQGFATANWGIRPFRAPHHTASAVAMVGGGTVPRPGEISLAHHGVLFLDELPEFPRQVLEVLREPLESGHIHIARARRQMIFPAQFQLIAAMNPCPCGFASDRKRPCECTPYERQRYLAKLSGPLLDRIDCHIQVPALPVRSLLDETTGEDSASIQTRVIACQIRQLERQGKLNSALSPKELAQPETLSREARTWLPNGLEQLHCSARAYHRIIKVARTIADMAASSQVQLEHLQEAFAYRPVLRSLQ